MEVWNYERFTWFGFAWKAPNFHWRIHKEQTIPCRRHGNADLQQLQSKATWPGINTTDVADKTLKLFADRQPSFLNVLAEPVSTVQRLALQCILQFFASQHSMYIHMQMIVYITDTIRRLNDATHMCLRQDSVHSSAGLVRRVHKDVCVDKNEP